MLQTETARNWKVRSVMAIVGQELSEAEPEQAKVESVVSVQEP